MPSCSMNQSYSGRWFSNSSVQMEWVMRFDRVRLAVGVVVHRVDAPLVARAVVRGVQDAVHDRIAHVEVGRGHVDLGAQRAAAVRELAGPHALEQVQVLLHGPIAVGTVACRAR